MAELELSPTTVEGDVLRNVATRSTSGTRSTVTNLPTVTNLRIYLFVAAVTVLVAFTLRACNLGTQSLWGDEGYTVLSPGQARWDIPSAMPIGSFSLYYYAVHAWMRLAGGSELAIRFPSLWAGVALVALIYVLGRRLGQARLGITAALLTSISPALIYQSQNARPYALLVLLIALSFYAILRIRSDPQALCWWIVAVAALIAAAYSHLYALVVFPGTLLILGWIVRPHRRLWRRFILSAAFLVIALAPWLVRSFLSTYGHFAGRAAASPLSPLQFIGLVGNALLLGDAPASIPSTYMMLGIATGLGIIIGGYALSRHSRRTVALTAFYVGMPVFIGYVVNLFVSYFFGRYLLFIAPLLFIAVAGATSLPRKWQTGVLAIPLLTFAIAWMPLSYQTAFPATHERLDLLATELRERAKPGDVLISNSSWRQMDLNYYLRGIGVTAKTIPLEDQPSAAYVRKQVTAISDGHARVWVAFFSAPSDSATNLIEPTLSERYARVSSNWYGTTRLSLYERPSGSSSYRYPADILFGNALQLVDYQMPPAQPLKPGDSLALSLSWQLAKPGDYALSLKLVDKNGQVWAQTDGRPQNGYVDTTVVPISATIVETRGLTIPWGTPPGAYDLTIAAYSNPQGTELGAIDSQGQSVPANWVLGQVTVSAADSPPSLALLPIARKTVLDLGIASMLGGSWPAKALAGEDMNLELFWQAHADLPQDPALEIQLMDSRGQVWTKASEPLDGNGSIKWHAGEVREGKYSLRVPPTAPQGQYHLQLRIVSGTEQPGPAPTSAAANLESIDITSRPRSFSPPAISQHLGAKFGGEIELLGYNMDATRRAQGNVFQSHAGARIKVDLFWQASESLGPEGIDSSYTVFVQMLDGANRVVAQHDGIPMKGAAPTITWAPGEVIKDSHTLALPADLAPGTYSVIVGLYNRDTMERLQTDSGGHVKMASIVIP